MNSTQIAMFIFFLMLHVTTFLPYTSAITSFGANDTDRLALLAIKSKILYDPQQVMSSWNDSLHYCQWQGITCGLRHKRVTVLDLSSRGLVGSLSPYIGNLSFLREIWLNNNTLGGGIPPELGRLFRLQSLGLFNNSLEGEIPTNLSNCANLSHLLLGMNNLVGKIPKELSSMLLLEILGFKHNNLSGGIPPFIGNLTSLGSISFTGCHLGGSIPNVFHKLRSLSILGLGGNDLIGTIPSSLYNLSLLNVFSVAENQLRGSLPKSLGLMLPQLHLLQLRRNYFTGSLPPSISNCSELDTIDAGSNNFEGKVAIDFANLQNLTYIYLSENNLGSGEHDELKFIDSLSNCSNLHILDLMDNKFSGVLSNFLWNFSSRFEVLSVSRNSLFGSLPLSIGNLISSTFLGLGDNQFTGTIPITIGNLQNLRRLLLLNNNFYGKIPASVGNLSSLIDIRIDNNKLEGTIPLSVGNCTSLIILSLRQNNLSGSIPRQIFGLSSLSIALDLESNHLSGPLPAEVGSLKTLGYLSVAGNYLSGELPSNLGGCSSLEFLHLEGNFFQGSIPTSMSSLRALQYLNLSHNNFSGPLPRFLEEFKLENLDISFNEFEGEIPTKGVFANSSGVSVVGNHRLCGGISELQLPKCSFKDSKSAKSLSLALIVLISVVSTLVGVAVLSFFLFCWHTKRRKDQPPGLVLKESFLKVSYERLVKATNGFSSENLIGQGASASVYKGVLDEDGETVAVKVLNLQHGRGFKSFITECDALRNIRHRNLVKIITSCSSVDFQGNDFKALVYEFMPNGSLERWLHSSPSTSNELHNLGLLQRISIAIDVACALDYLHHYSEHPIIHCDLKPSNILLDADMVAHVGDFGLARILLPELSNANPSSTTGIRGTIGYAPPEYGLGNEVSTNGDVYSYGILLLELVIGKRPTDPLFQGSLNLHNYASMAIANGALEIVEPMLLKGKNKECLISILKIGVACSVESPQDRMDIRQVIQELHLLRGSTLFD